MFQKRLRSFRNGVILIELAVQMLDWQTNSNAGASLAYNRINNTALAEKLAGTMIHTVENVCDAIRFFCVYR